MCGITGFVGRGGPEDLRRMTGALVHRGPDAEGYWVDAGSGVHLGHRRLSILDLEGGSQPMATTDGALIVVFNGEIYNHQELRRELEGRGHVFATDHSDTEVLLHGYREWGPALQERLNGMWAFAVYDVAARLLFCSRDRFGKKPFYWARTEDAFVFGSELEALRRHPSVKATVSRRAVKKYFAYGFIPAPLSIHEGIWKLPGGHFLEVDVATLEPRVRKWWAFVLEPTDRIPRNPMSEWGEELRERLDRAVRCRLIADVPLGIFLSGGIDSSAVTAFAARHVPAGRLKTFSIGFEEPSFDESGPALEVAKRFQTDHHLEVLSQDRAGKLLEEALKKLDEPLGDSSLLPTWLLCRFTRRQVTVALGGDGGDELFAGYDPFRALRKAAWYHRLMPARLHEGIRCIFDRLPVSHSNMSLDFKIKRTLRGLSYPPRCWLPAWMGPLAPDEIAELLDEPVELEDLYSEAITQWDACASGDLVDKTLQFYTQLYLQDDILVKVDRMSMQHGLEARTPFLDIDLVDFVRKIPSSYKYRHGTTKWLLKKALEPVLPASILYRAKKGFGSPVGAWFRGGVLPVADQDVFGLNAAFVRRRLERHLSGRSDERGFLWNLYLLGLCGTAGGLTPRARNSTARLETQRL